MVKDLTEVLDATFAALSDPTRRAIVAELSGGERVVTELARPFAMSLPAISKHLRVLEQAGLIVREKRGRTVVCRLVAKPLEAAATFLEQYRHFWQTRLDALAAYLDASTEKEETPCPTPNPEPKPRSRSPAGSRPRVKKSSGRGRKQKP